MTRVLETLERAEVNGERAYRCLRCEHVLGPAREDYRSFALSFESPMSQGVPPDAARPESEFALRHYCCPQCAVLLEVEPVVRGGEPSRSIELD